MQSVCTFFFDVILGTDNCIMLKIVVHNTNTHSGVIDGRQVDSFYRINYDIVLMLNY